MSPAPKGAGRGFASHSRSAGKLVLLANRHFCLKEIPVKKIALTLIAVSALGVAACSGSAGNNTTNDLNSSGPAVEDTNGAMNDMREDANGVDANGAETNSAGGEVAPGNDSGAANGSAGNEAK
jgi:hypothetical protein